MNQFVKVVLDADPGKLITGFAQAEGATAKLGASMSAAASLAKSGANAYQAAADVISRAGKRIAIVGGAGTTAFTAMGVSAATFQGNMLNVRTLMGQDFSNKAFEKMGNDVLDLSRKFPQSANDMSKAIYDIASSGFYGADALTVLKASTLAATAGLSSTANSATAITAVLNAYGLKAKESGDVSDVLFQTVNLGVVSFDQLTGVIGESVGTAAAAKVTYAELGSAIATMTLSGISFSEAGVSANRVLQSLIKPSTELQVSLKALGYESGVQAIQVDGLHGVIEKLRVASQGNIATLLQWFPEIRAARGALALMSAEGENYNRVAAGIEDKNQRMGATQRAYNIQAQGAAQEFQKMMNSLHDLGIEIGQKFLPAATLLEKVIGGVVNFFAKMPAPMRSVIAFAGILSSAILFLGGAYIAWQAKSLLTTFLLHGLGTGIVKATTAIGAQETSLGRLGAGMGKLSGPFATTKAAILGIGAVGNRIGSVFTNVGNRLTGLGDRMTIGGSAATGLGNAFIKVGGSGNFLGSVFSKLTGGIRSVISNLGTLALAAFAVIQTFNASKNAASDWADEVDKNLKKGDPVSTIKSLDQIQKKYQEIFKDQKSAGTVGGFFTSFTKGFADIATNFVGWDPVKTSSLDMLKKWDALDAKQKQIVKGLQNIQQNATVVFTTVFPKDETKIVGPLDSEVAAYDKRVARIQEINRKMSGSDFFKPIKIPKLDMSKMLPVTGNEIQTISRLANNMGIDLSKGMSISSPARQKLIAEYRVVKGLVEATGLSTTRLTEETIAQFQDMAKAIDDAGKKAGESFGSSFDVFSKLDAKSGNVGQQITDFYKTATADATKFYDGIITLQARGLSATSVAAMLAAGPEKAGPAVEAMVADVSGNLIKIMNEGEEVLAKISEKVVTIARLTQQAVEDKTGQAAKHLTDAIAVTNVMGQIGPLATAEDVAKMLGWDITRVQDAAKIFSLNIATAVKPGDLVKDPFTGAMGPFPAAAVQGVKDRQKYSTDLYNTLRTTFGSDVVSSDISNFVKKLDEALYTKSGAATTGDTRKKKIDELSTSMQAVFKLPSEKALILRIIGQEEASTRLDKFRAFGLFGPKSIPSDQIVNFIISLTGDANALKKIHDVAIQMGLAPSDYNIMLHMLGTDEAMIQAAKVDDAVKLLQGKDIPVTMNNVDAIMKSKDVETTIAQLYQTALQKGQLTVTATVHGKKEVDDLKGSIDGVKDKDVHVKTFMESFFGTGVANGAIFYPNLKYGDGGHNAFITHSQRTFGEPETGGEGYIPLALSKRLRSTKILSDIAKMFGYGLTHFAAGGITSVPAVSLSPSGRGDIHLHFKNDFKLSGNGDAAVLEVVKEAFAEHDHELEQKLRTYR